MIIEKYNTSNYWAIREDTGQLICVSVYKKGALEIVRKLDEARNGKTYQYSSTYDTDKIITNLNKIIFTLTKVIKQLNFYR